MAEVTIGDRNVILTVEQLRQRYNLDDIASTKLTVSQINGVLNETNAELSNFVTQVTEDIENLQSQVDGTITSWFYTGEPTLENAPASDWLESEYEAHRGDLYYDQATGYAYRFSYVSEVYQWVQLQDTDATLALSIANEAKDTADSKRRIFVATPTVPYDVGDVWLGNDTNDLKRAQAARAVGENYNVADWIKAVKYTDDSTFDVVISKINDSPETAKITSTKLSADVITTNNLSAQNISAAQITAGTLATARLNSDVITTSNLSAQTISASQISTGTMSANRISGGTIAGTNANFGSSYSGGSLKYYNGVGFLSCGAISDHPWLSGINLSTVNGLRFYTGTNVNSVGSYVGSILCSSVGTISINPTGNFNLNCDSAGLSANDGYMKIIAGSPPSTYYGTNTGSIYVACDENINLKCSGYVYIRGNSYSTSTYKVLGDSAGPSSLNLKDNLVKFDSTKYNEAINLLKEIDVYNYDYKYNLGRPKHDFGFIIDYIQNKDNANDFFVFKEEKAVVNEDLSIDQSIVNEVNEDKILNYKRFDLESLVKYLFVVSKAQQEKIDSLEARIEKLERGE